MTWPQDRPVYRTKPLPKGSLRGTHLMPRRLLEITRNVMTGFALAGIHDAGHEGLVFWGGREADGLTVFTTVIIPEVEHSHGRVAVSRHGFGVAARRARRAGILPLCQVHSHPGADGRHSDGDDELVGLPTEGMLSVVVPHFGVDWEVLGDASVHQYQEGQWVLCSAASVEERFSVVPMKLDVTE